MPISKRDLDSAFHGAGQKAGLEIWRIESFQPVSIPKETYGKFYTGDSYIVLKTTSPKNGALRHDIHYWIGKESSQDEAGTAAIKTIELDAALGGRAVQYREVQGHETAKFLSYFKPCIIPQPGGVASGFNHSEVNKCEHQTRLYVCRGKHVVTVKEVPFVRSSLNHDDIFILDTESKIFQFSGSNSCIQERAKALEVVQYIKDTYHDGKCDVAAVEDGQLMADAEAGEFWGFFGGFAPLPKKGRLTNDEVVQDLSSKLYCIKKEELAPVEADILKKELLDTSKCYLLDCGVELFVWLGKNTSIDERKTASKIAEDMINGPDRSNVHVVRVIEGSETVMFRAKFDSWPQTANATEPEDGRSRVAALLKRQGVDVKGLVKEDSQKEQPQPYIDCAGDLKVWLVNGQEKSAIPSEEQIKFYTGDCYIFQYSYSGEVKEEVLIGTWFGQKSIEEEREAALSLAGKMVESLKYQAVQVRVYEGKEPIQFYSILQFFIVYKGGISSGYKGHIAENNGTDETYSEDGLALFRVQGSGPDNMQAIQVEAVAASLNSSYAYILHNGSSVFTWIGSLTTIEDQDLVERQLDIIKPNGPSKMQKEGTECEEFWNLLGGKSEYSNQKITNDTENDPHLFSCIFSKGQIENLQVVEIFNFSQDDLMTEDTFILDCNSSVSIWVGQQVDVKLRKQAVNIGEKFLEKDILLQKLSPEAPLFVIMEGSEPPFFTRFFTWDYAKPAMHGNSFQRKLAVMKNGVPALLDRPKRRPPISHAGRSAPLEKPQRTRSMSFSPDRPRVRGRSVAFNALAANFDNQSTRNLSTPPPLTRNEYKKSGIPEPTRLASRSAAIAALTSTFELQKDNTVQGLRKAENAEKISNVDPDAGEDDSLTNTIESVSVQEDSKEEDENDEGTSIFPYEQLRTDSDNPAPSEEVDVIKRETYLSSKEFNEKFGLSKNDFSKLPKWKRDKMKKDLKLF